MRLKGPPVPNYRGTVAVLIIIMGPRLRRGCNEQLITIMRSLFGGGVWRASLGLLLSAIPVGE